MRVRAEQELEEGEGRTDDAPRPAAASGRGRYATATDAPGSVSGDTRFIVDPYTGERTRVAPGQPMPVPLLPGGRISELAGQHVIDYG